MITTDEKTIQPIIDYICSQSGFVSLDKADFDYTCPKPVMMIDQKGQSIEEVIKAVTDSISENELPEKSLVFIESKGLMMSDIDMLKDAFKGLNVSKMGFAFNEPENARVRVILIG